MRRTLVAVSAHIRSVTAGVVGVRAIDWQNRPTFQRVVQLTSHR